MFYRLNIHSDDIMFLGETDIDIIQSNILELNPKLVIIDSIQTMYSEEITSAAGTVSQVREITSRVMRICKDNSITTIIIGHVRAHGRYSFILRRRTILFISYFKKCKKSFWINK